MVSGWLHHKLPQKIIVALIIRSHAVHLSSAYEKRDIYRGLLLVWGKAPNFNVPINNRLADLYGKAGCNADIFGLR